MKKPDWKKPFSLALCALLALSGPGGASAAACAADAPALWEAAAPADTGDTKNEKVETVYVLAGADGTVQEVIVSDWLKNRQGADTIEDVTRLTGIENVKGDEPYTLGAGDSCVWDAGGNDIYYQGSLDEELPVSVSVSYTLDGAPISAEELAGKSGRVTIRFDYTNRQYEPVELDGSEEKIYVPFAMMTGVLLDNAVFSNISVTNGKLLNDGDRTLVAGLAFPGLQESLGLDRQALELPDYVEINADAEGFALQNTITIATNGLLTEAADRAADADQTDEVNSVEDQLRQLTDAVEQLAAGSSRLYDGLCTLLSRSQELTGGVDSLASGAAALQQGAGDLDAGAAQLQAGAASLQQGLTALTEQNAALVGGAAQVFETLLATASAQLQAAGVPAPQLTVENYAQVLEEVMATVGDSPAGQQVAALKASLDNYNGFYQGLQGYTAGVAAAGAGAGELSQGVDSLKAGADSLSAGAGQLYGGVLALQGNVPALVGGVTQLRDGAATLSDGLREFQEQGVRRLTSAFSGRVEDLTARLDALKAVSERYNSFSGLGPEMDGRVKFIWRTDAVEKQE